MINASAYLERIGLGGTQVSADVEMLRKLQYRHLLSVPFENLDIHRNHSIILNTARFYDKIVGDKRGGFCYELNGLFNELLCDLGFTTRLVSARVFNGTGFGPEFDHAAVIVTVDGQEYLADVGFGDFAAEPLRLTTDIEQQDREGVFIVRQAGPDTLEIVKRYEDGIRPQYVFSPVRRDLTEFAEMCDFQQYSPESHFTKGKVCSILTETGRKTLTDKKFIVKTNGEKTETEVGSADDFDRLLNDEFGIRPLQ